VQKCCSKLSSATSLSRAKYPTYPNPALGIGIFHSKITKRTYAAPEELKAKLAAEQLFAQEAKQALPEHVQHLAVISSPSGAAVHDIIHVLKRRNPSIQVTLVPSSVQGAEAPSQLIKALELCRHIHGLDAIIIGRGGGSLEDLWAFNDEQLARAIHAIPIPIVSAVGHEVDVSISDFVADYRAPTPSAAAEAARVLLKSRKG